MIFNPQPIIDHENSTTLAQVDLEWGFMIAPKSGIGGYIRPGVGIGEHRPFQWNLEFAINLFGVNRFKKKKKYTIKMIEV